MLSVLLAPSGLSGCASGDPASSAAASEEALGEPSPLPLVDTRPWMVEVDDPPSSWQEIVRARPGVLRHRFVRFREPSSLPDPASRFLIVPFPGTRLVLRLRRAGPMEGVGYSWFGMFEGEARGFGGLVVRPNGRVSAEIQAPDGRRFQVANVGSNAYVILEVEPPPPLRCGLGGEQ